MVTINSWKMGGKPLNSQSRQLIYNVYLYFLHEANAFKKDRDGYFQKIQKRVSIACGVSVGTVKKILKENDQKDKSAPFQTPKRGRKNKKFRLNLGGFDYCVIRKMVYDLHLQFMELPCLRTLKEKLGEVIQFGGCVETLRKILKEMGFRFVKTESNREVLMEKHDIRLRRMKYLREIQKMRADGKNIVFMDELCVRTSDTKEKTDTKKKLSNQPGPKTECIVIFHAGNEKGFLPGALMILKCLDTGGDFHKEINEDQYQSWIRSHLLPNLPPDSVLVIDNAPYHNEITVKPPNSNTPKVQIISWLLQHNIPHDPNSLKIDLYDIVKKYKERFSEFVIDRILEEHGHTILRLPPYHSDFNPIENIWTQIKAYVATKNVANVAEIEETVLEKINTIELEEWKNVCVNSINCEDEYKKFEQLFDLYTDNLTINMCSSGEESDNSNAGEFSDMAMSDEEMLSDS